MPLVNSDNWKASFLKLRSLRFHPHNPRFPELKPGSSEKQIIETLCERGDVMSLAKQIAEKGWLRERLIVVQEGAKNIVYEGNRRLCALRILENPELAPPSKRRTAQRLSEQAVLPKKVAVEIVPSKFDAEVVMFSKHAGEAWTVKWSPVQQAAFIAGQIEEGLSIDEVCTQRQIKRETVLEALALLDLYKIARSVELSEKAKAMLDDPDKFPTSTVFERIFAPKQSRHAIGVEFTEKGIVIKAEKNSFGKAIAKMMEDAASKEIDTRQLNSTSEQLAYVKELGVELSETLTSVSDFVKETTNAVRSVATIHQATKTKVTRSARPSNKILPADLILQFEHEKLSRMLTEGRYLNVEAAPHAAALLLRSMIEISASVWLKKKRRLHEITPRNVEFGPSCAELLNFLNTEKLNLGFDHSVKSSLDALVSKKIKTSKFDLDRITHSPDAIATSENVIELRELSLPLLRVLLTK